MNTLIAKKVGMTQIFDENAKAMGVTVLDVSDCRVVQVKNEKVDGYNAVQLTIGKTKKPNNPLKNHFEKHNTEPGEIIFEVEVHEDTELKPGEKINVNDIFEVGQKVDISGISKGKGFAGVMKRHNFAGQKASHGVHKVHRAGGSIGNASFQDMYLKDKKWLEEWEIKKQPSNQSQLLVLTKKKITFWLMVQCLVIKAMLLKFKKL